MVVDSKLTLNWDELSRREWEKLFKQLTFINPKGEMVQCFRRTLDAVQLPRGAWNLVPDHVTYEDNRVCPDMPPLKFTIKLDDLEMDERFAGQSKAVDEMVAAEQGQVIRAPGTGKTQIALGFISEARTRSLVLVHTHDILRQWVRYAQNALPDVEIGIIQGKTVEVGHLTIATVQTFKNFITQADEEWLAQWGCVIADECHHGAAPTWEAILNSMPAYFRFGFTASATRADGMEPAIKYIIGPVIHKQKFSSPVDLKVVPVKTNFKYMYRGHWDWTRLIERLVKDDGRNRQIAEIADREIRKGNSVLVLSRRIEHLERISERMSEESEILTGKRSKKDRERILRGFTNGRVGAVLATQLADEALDVPRLNRIMLVHPGKHEGKLVQQIGRAIREFPTKKDARIYDLVDFRVGILRRQWNQRKKAYKKIGISVKSTGRLFK